MRIALLIVAFFGGVVVEASAASERPNIVLFISDDHGYLDCSIADNSDDIPTPNLARLAEQGMTFDLAFVASPSCAPSRATLLTGLMPMRNGAMLNHQPPRPEPKTYPEFLQELGYEVVAFGKVAHYKQGHRYGFDLVAHDTFHDHECIPAALQFLDEWSGDKPLCLCVGTNWPHVPWPDEYDLDPATLEIPPTHVDTPETQEWRARYAAAVERFDTNLGRVYDRAQQQLGNDTVFIHFSDHGAQWPFGKWNLYDAGIRVAMVVVWPGVTEPASRSRAMVSLADVLPTVVEIAGGKPPKNIDGRSFVEVLQGDDTEHRERIFATHSGDGRMNAYPMRSVRTNRWKYIRNLDPEGEHHTHIDRGKVVDGNSYWSSWLRAAESDPSAAAVVERYYHRPPEELYDLHSDPHEQHNLVDDPQLQAQLEELRQALDTWMQKQGDEGMPTETEVRNSFLGQTPRWRSSTQPTLLSASGDRH